MISRDRHFGEGAGHLCLGQEKEQHKNLKDCLKNT